jgi:hypothetical protein
MLFIKKLQASSKVRAVRKRIRAIDAAKKRLSGEYKRVLKSEGSRLSKQIKKTKKSKKSRNRKRR